MQSGQTLCFLSVDMQCMYDSYIPDEFSIPFNNRNVLALILCLTLYLIEMLLSVFANRPDPDQAALVRKAA